MVGSLKVGVGLAYGCVVEYKIWFSGYLIAAVKIRSPKVYHGSVDNGISPLQFPICRCVQLVGAFSLLGAHRSLSCIGNLTPKGHSKFVSKSPKLIRSSLETDYNKLGTSYDSMELGLFT